MQFVEFDILEKKKYIFLCFVLLDSRIHVLHA